MKNLMKFLVPALFAMVVSACDMFNVDVDSTFGTELNINVEDGAAKSTNAHAFSASNTIDPMDDDDVAEYADKIVNVDVDGIIAEVLSVSDTDVAFLAGTVLEVYNDQLTATYTFDEDWPIEMGTTVSIEDLGDFYDDLSEILMDMEVFTVSMTGTSSKAGVTVTIGLDINTTVTGSPF